MDDVEPSDLAGAEQLLWAAFPRGAWVDLREGDPLADDPGNAHSWGLQREIRAEVIRSLLLGACPAEPGSAPGVRLRGARITGRLDLMGAAVDSALVCEYCCFEGEIRLVEASSKTVRIVDSRFPGLNGTRLRADGILNLWGCAINGVLRLDQAHVTGQVCVRGATVAHGSVGAAFSADGLTVDGDLDWAELTVRGSVHMSGARISGSADLNGVQIFHAGERALTMSHSVIGGKLTGENLQVDGETRLHNARISGNIQLPGATLRNRGGVALGAGGLDVGGGMFCIDGFTAEGEINLISARLGDIIALPGARLDNRRGTALNLDRATMGDCDLADLACCGRVSLIGASVASRLSLDRACLDAGQQGSALTADGIVVGGVVALAGLHAIGEVSMRTARVGEGMLLSNACLDNPAGVAVCLDGTEVAADVVCDGLTVAGEMKLTATKVAGQLSFDHVRLANPGGAALTASGLRASTIVLRPAAAISELVDLGHAQVDILRDNPAFWPDRLNLNGLTYRVLEPRLRAQERLQWLARDPDRHEPQPYEQLAAIYTGAGLPAEARRVLYCRERQQRATKTPFGKAWSLIQDVTVGYGYQPWRAVLWLAFLLITGSVVYGIKPPPALQLTAAPHFNPVIYTLNLLIPVVDFGQRDAFNPAGAEQWLSYLFIAAGWILATTVATGIARVLNRQ